MQTKGLITLSPVPTSNMQRSKEDQKRTDILREALTQLILKQSRSNFVPCDILGLLVYARLKPHDVIEWGFTVDNHWFAVLHSFVLYDVTGDFDEVVYGIKEDTALGTPLFQDNAIEVFNKVIELIK